MGATGHSFYSCGPGNPHDIESHDTRDEALQTAGVGGLVWFAEIGTVRQVHLAADGQLMTLSPDHFASERFTRSLQEKGLMPSPLE